MSSKDDDDDLERHLQMEQEDGRSWIQLYDENASLRKVLANVMQAKNANNNSNNNSTVENEQEELLSLRTQVLQCERLLKILNEENQVLTKSLKKIDEGCRQKYGIEIVVMNEKDDDDEEESTVTTTTTAKNENEGKSSKNQLEGFNSRILECCG